MSKMIDVVAAIIWNEQGKILIAKRKTGKAMGGFWEFPGGKIEDKETAEESLQREIREELNVEIVVDSYLGSNIHDYGDFSIHLMAYNAKLVGGTLEAREHEELLWVGVEQLENYEFAPADRPLVKKLVEQ